MSVKFEHYRMVPMIVVMGTIFFLSHLPGDSLSLPAIPGIDKVAHFVIYGVLAATVILVHSSASRKAFPLKVCLASIGACLLFGISDEFHQSFIPGRFVSAADILANIAGASSVSVGWLFLVRKKICWRKT